MSSSNTLKSAEVSLGDEEAVKEILVDTVFGLWDIVHNLTRLRPSKRERYQVTIFGSARAQPGTLAYEEVKRFAKALAELDCDIISGGGPGLMQAANEGASAAKAEGVRSVGIRVDLPFEQKINPFVGEGYQHRTFFTRLHHFVLISDAFVVAPGGIGTVLETMMIWQLLQVGHIKNVPLILVGTMWPELVAWAEKYMVNSDTPLASAGDIAIPKCVPGADEAVTLIRGYRASWQPT